jgi:hypothetical protein
MNDCCDQWLMSLEPRQPKEGKHIEKHQCPTCKTWHMVIFQCVATLGGGPLECAAVGADPATK